MLAISRALMGRPKLLLLDEPSLGLSPKLTKDIFEIITRINRERELSIIVVEQNAAMALSHAHFGYILEVGRVVMEDSCERLMQKDDIKEFYLGMHASGVRGERRWKRKNSASGPAFITKPFSAASVMTRLSVVRGQPANGVPSGLAMSQMMRPTRAPLGSVHGKTWKVARSGLRYMSDSSMRTKPSIEDPSNMICPSSASVNCRSGTSTFLMTPRMSVN